MPFFRLIISSIFLFISFQLQANTLANLLEQGQKNLVSGNYYQASDKLQQLETQAVAEQNAYTVTLAQGLQGYLELQRQNYPQAESLLSKALEQTQANAWHDLTVRFAVYLGELNERQQHLNRAQQYFTLAETAAKQVADKTFLISSWINQAKLALVEQKIEAAWSLLQQAKTLLADLSVSPISSQLWLNVGYQTLQLIDSVPKNTTAAAQNDFISFAFFSLDKALSQAQQFTLPKIQAAVLSHLAVLYRQQQRPTEAINLVLAGIQIAQKEDANNLLTGLEWQLGQLYKEQHQPVPAIAAYKRALANLEAIRLDIPVSYKKGHSSFKATFAPLYLALADLLLQQAPTASAQQQQVLLHQAKDTIELMKKTELEDYFQSRCEIIAQPIDLQKKDPYAAAIYPISLANRLELIVYTRDGLHQFTLPVTHDKLKEQVKLFSTNLRNYRPFNQSKPQAQLLYQWLIAPIKGLLEKQQIETLIYIPDGKLRLIPLSALYDGKRFLIEDYAVVTSPGMSLIETNSDAQQEKNILLAGMSVPGNVVSELPESLLVDFVDLSTAEMEEKPGLTRDIKQPGETDSELAEAENERKMRQLREVMQKPGMMAMLKKELTLPGVEVEIKQLATENEVPYLLNESFSLENLTEALTAQPHKILHIASHGFFGATAEDSFVMTYDKILTMKKLERLLNTEFFKRHPLDLITLSACQTAQGDDRSPLGISGIAIKAKVHSALGSLWSVSDLATSQLMGTFYQILKTTRLSKAKALQQAEISLLKQQEFSNPSDWSPFVLVGDWL